MFTGRRCAFRMARLCTENARVELCPRKDHTRVPDSNFIGRAIPFKQTGTTRNQPLRPIKEVSALSTRILVREIRAAEANY